MAQLYRKSALEKISNPEQLDKALTVTSPMSWLVLAALTVMVIVTVIWSIVGTLPITVSTNGIVASPVSTNAVYIPETGTVSAVLVHPGQNIASDVPVLTYTIDGSSRTINSSQVGTVANISVNVGDRVTQGSEILRVSPNSNSKQVIVCYLKASDATKVRRGMEAYIYLTGKDSQTYGHMQARVINVDTHVTSTTGMYDVIGSDNNLASVFTSESSAVVAVTCELYLDEETVSGYYWSNEKGKNLAVPNGALVTAKIITEEIAPITKLFSKLKEIWGE